MPILEKKMNENLLSDVHIDKRLLRLIDFNYGF